MKEERKGIERIDIETRFIRQVTRGKRRNDEKET